MDAAEILFRTVKSITVGTRATNVHGTMTAADNMANISILAIDKNFSNICAKCTSTEMLKQVFVTKK